MSKILGIDTSNYTTSVAVIHNNELIYEKRVMLDVKKGERGLRQSEALFQHIQNLPELLNNDVVHNLDGVCVSIKPRSVEGSYMPVFKAGENFARAIAYTNGIPLFFTTHQEGHIEAALNSVGLKENEFIAIHMSGGTTEVLHVHKKEEMDIKIIGGTKDISLGQFIDRIGVAMGLSFPAGKFIDDMAGKTKNKSLRIPSRVDGLFFNLSGPETKGLGYVENGNNQEEVAYSVMLCIAKTLEKLFVNIFKTYRLPIILIGGVASSCFLRDYLRNKFGENIVFSKPICASDNAIGVALIGQKKIIKDI